MVLFLSLSVKAQDVTIWGGPGDVNGEFANGLNDWTTNFVTPNANAIWVWDADGRMDQGSFWGDAGTLASPSISNGCAGFDSDYYDNNGDFGTLGSAAFGSGPAPAPQEGHLISPVIDCSSNNTVWLMFNQSHRNFQSNTFVDVSFNGGDSFDSTYHINSDVPVNRQQGISGNRVQMIDITSAAANQAEVVIRFRFDANYYYWMIDDVWLVEQPRYNVSIGDYFFYPLLAKQTPVRELKYDTMGFFTEIVNNGAEDATDIVTYVEILFDNGSSFDVVYEDSIEYGNLASGAVDTVEFQNTFAPDLVVGTYFVRYSVSDRGIDDFNSYDNSKSEEFYATNSTYALHDETNPSQAFAVSTSEPYGWGPIFRFWEENVDKFAIESLTFGASANGDMTGGTVEFYVLELKETFSFTGPGLFDDVNEENHKIIAFNDYTYADNSAGFDLVNTDDTWLNWSTFFEECIELEPGKEYAFMPYFANSSIGWFQTVSQETNYWGSNSTLMWGPGNNGPQFFSNFTDGEEIVPTVTLNLKFCPLDADETILPENALSAFPNPISDIVNLDVQLEKTSNITITLADAKGSVIDFQNHKNVNSGQFQFSTSELAPGSYIVRLATKHGKRTIKLIKQ